MSIKVVNLNDKFSTFSAHWSPKVVGALNGQQVKLVKFQGEFVMHHHEQEDELFLVVEGTMYMELEGKTLEVKAGEFVIIPRMTLHKPYAKEEVKVLLFEPASTLNTGNVNNDFTVENLDVI